MLHTGSAARSISEEADDSQSDTERYEDDRPAVYTFVEWVRRLSAGGRHTSPPLGCTAQRSHTLLCCYVGAAAATSRCLGGSKFQR